MIKAFDSYSLVAGSHGMRGSIWRGPDHLLIVEGKGFLLPLSENYRRIDYQNIQALGTTRTSRFVWLTVILAILTGLLGMGFYAMMDDRNLSLVAGLPFGLMLILLLLHLGRGPTCRCTLQTEVLSLRLRPLTRLRKAVKVLADIEQLCLEHQKDISMSMAAGEMPSGMTARVRPPGAKPPWPGSRWLLAAGAGLCLWGAVLAGELFIPGAAFTVLNITLALAGLTLLIIAFVHVFRYQAPQGLKPIMTMALVLQGLTGMGLYAAAIAMDVVSGIRQSTGSETGNFQSGAWFDRFANLTLEDTGNAGWLVVILGVIMLGLGSAMIPFGPRPTSANVAPNEPPPPQPPQVS